jgi:RNA polymerase sigma-70 factor, ECF subfamily
MLPYDNPVRLSNRLRLDLPDAELVGELLNNRPEAHRLVVQRFTPLVRALLRRSLGPKNDIDDAQQEVFWSLFRSIDSLRDPCSLRAFIMTITFRAVLRERRRRRVTIPLESVPARMGPEAKRDEAEASHALLRLGSLLLRLNERERNTFVMRFVEGMTVSEIAEELAVSEATTRRSYTRAWSLVSKWAAQDPFLMDYFGDAPHRASPTHDPNRHPALAGDESVATNVMTLPECKADWQPERAAV